MITRYKQQNRPVQAADEAKLVEDLNTFYSRSDKRDFHMEQEQAPKRHLTTVKQWKIMKNEMES